jgi:hypothetical protein
VTNRVEAREPSGRKLGASESRVFVRDGLRSYRRSYRRSEVAWGAGIAASLVGVLVWVRYRGGHPDPALYDMSAALAVGVAQQSSPPALEPGVPLARAPLADRGPGMSPPSAPGQPGAEGSSGVGLASERGPLPVGLAAGAFREGKVGAYTPDNLYVKIDGRAEFYTSFGVKSMHAVTLEASSGASVEIELYDLGASRNALGAYNGERPPGVDSALENGSTFRFDRNAAFLTRGPYYARFVGSDETPEVVAEVRRLLELLRQQLPAEELPWAFSLFVDQLKLPASQVSYLRENAFSFGFARDVYKVALSPADSQENLEAFVTVKADAAAATRAAQQYRAGFASLGAPAGKTPAGVPLFKDEFLGSFSTATASERWVIGVNGAPSAARAHEVLQQLENGLHALPEAVRAQAQPSPEQGEGEKHE